jgi:hypothetical protein
MSLLVAVMALVRVGIDIAEQNAPSAPIAALEPMAPALTPQRHVAGAAQVGWFRGNQRCSLTHSR